MRLVAGCHDPWRMSHSSTTCRAARNGDLEIHVSSLTRVGMCQCGASSRRGQASKRDTRDSMHCERQGSVHGAREGAKGHPRPLTCGKSRGLNIVLRAWHWQNPSDHDHLVCTYHNAAFSARCVICSQVREAPRDPRVSSRGSREPRPSRAPTSPRARARAPSPIPRRDRPTSRFSAQIPHPGAHLAPPL